MKVLKNPLFSSDHIVWLQTHKQTRKHPLAHGINREQPSNDSAD